MWNQRNERLVSDEYVSDGCQQKVPFARHGAGFSHLARYPSSQTKDHLFDSKSNTKESDSGFLSDMGIQEDPLQDSGDQSCLSSDKTPIEDATKCSDSGLDLDVLPHDRDVESSSKTSHVHKNNLSTLQQTNQSRQITVNDLLRPDEDGDT